MRLIDVKIGGLKEFFGSNIPEEYAILSHTWGDEEVSLQEMSNLTDEIRQKQGYLKILYTIEQAERDGLRWVWIDTCCIDKTSSAELTEAINSMYNWYKRAAVCYAFLADVPADGNFVHPESAFRKSRWFTRGWTLQELIAPPRLIFYGNGWQKVGRGSISEPSYSDRRPDHNLLAVVHEITDIPLDLLRKARGVTPASSSVAQRMCWASKRTCTRKEDEAYCLMGLFGVNMPLLYGEEEKAFQRLQAEIMRTIDDHSILAWTVHELNWESWAPCGIFAPSPANFRRSLRVKPTHEELDDLSELTRQGLRMTARLSDKDFPKTHHLWENNKACQFLLAPLNCAINDKTVFLLLIIDQSMQRHKSYVKSRQNMPSVEWAFRMATPQHMLFEASKIRPRSIEPERVFVRLAAPEPLRGGFLCDRTLRIQGIPVRVADWMGDADEAVLRPDWDDSGFGWDERTSTSIGMYTDRYTTYMVVGADWETFGRMYKQTDVFQFWIHQPSIFLLRSHVAAHPPVVLAVHIIRREGWASSYLCRLLDVAAHEAAGGSRLFATKMMNEMGIPVSDAQGAGFPRRVRQADEKLEAILASDELVIGDLTMTAQLRRSDGDGDVPGMKENFIVVISVDQRSGT